MGMQTVVCGGLIVFVVVIILLLRRDPEETVQTPPRGKLSVGGSAVKPLPGGGSGPLTVDVWDEIRAQEQAQLTIAQKANRQALAQAARVWELTGHTDAPDVEILPRGGSRELGPGEPTVTIVLREKHAEAVRRFYGDEEG